MRADFPLELQTHTVGPAGERAVYAVEIPADLLYFEGHFPGAPLLPGVAQLAVLVLAQVHRLWPYLGEPSRVSRLKFKRPIGPGDRLLLSLELSRAAVPRVDFSLERAGDCCTTGAMTFATASPPQTRA